MNAIKKRFKKYILLLSIIFIITCFNKIANNTEQSENSLVFGTTLTTKSLDPADDYSGWFLVRYGIGETLFKLNNNMEPENWLASGYEQIDNTTWKVTINEGVYFQNGVLMTAEKVKSSIERTIELNSRAASDLNIASIVVEGNSLIFYTTEANPTFINDLCEPYVAIIDVDAGTNFDTCPIGTGPFMVETFNPSGTSYYIKNENYWDGEVKLDEIKVIPISDTDTLSMALQSGEIDVAQGLSYSSIELFSEDDDYKISSTDTSRTIVMYFNEENTNLSNSNVRKAINMLIDKETYASILLNGEATASTGAFPSNMDYGSSYVEATEYDIEKAKALLTEEGYADSNGDGILDKDGENLTLTLVTYTTRAELSTLAQAIQADLKDVGIDVEIKISDNITDVLSAGNFDLCLYSLITSSTGDSASYLSNTFKTNGALNYGGYSNEQVDNLIDELLVEFDEDRRNELAIEIQQIVLNDDAYNYICNLKMSFVMKNTVEGIEVHPTDYYQFNADTNIQ